ncbi:MAG: flagellar basal body-associated FliL family protein [Gammaproteobacteria bacterium]|nr:flagellar basal body-associated FliL family protein [Gammaproteobacteria bacterium]
MANEAPPAATDGKKKMIIIAAVVVVLLLGGGAGAFFMLKGDSKGGEKEAAEAQAEGKGGEKSEEKGGEGGHGEGKAGEATYTSLDPAFVVNFQDKNNRTKYLKADMSVVSSAAKSEEIVRKHMPAIRNAVIMLLSRQAFEDLQSADGKEKLRAAALKEVQAVLTKQTGKPVVEDLFFSSFVMQ